MHHLHAVPHPRVHLLHRRAQLVRLRPRAPGVTSPGASTSTNGTRPPARFLSRSTSASTSSTRGAREAQRGSPRAASSSATSARSASRPDSRSAASRPIRHRLAVPVARVAGGRLDRVAHRVAEVEHLAAAGVALVLGHHRELRAHAAHDHVSASTSPPWRTRAHSGPPAISAVFTTSA